MIELREAEHIGAPDDERIGGRDVKAGFDDRRREQDIELSLVEGGHALLEIARRHLPMRDDEFRLRHGLAQKCGGVVQIFDARTDEKGLAAAIMFAQQRLAHDERIERRNEAAHGEAIDRRRWR